MRKQSHKHLVVFSVLALIFIPTIQAQQTMRINLNDGTVMEIALANIEKLTFSLDFATGTQPRPEVVKQLLRFKAYPNPAKDNVMIHYTLPGSGMVNIDIFNLAGNRINTLNRGFQQSGDYQYRMNTNNLSSGTYLLRVQQNNEFVTEKVIVTP